MKRKKWKKTEIILILDSLHTYVIAGLPINVSLKLVQNSLSKKISSDLIRVIDDVESGMPVYKSLSMRIGVSKTVTSIIEYGEKSALLGDSLGTSRDLLERENELIKKCLSALTYPLIIGLFTVLLTIGMVRGVMPQIIPMLVGMKIDLPAITKVVMFISDHILYLGFWVLVSTPILVIVCLSAYKKIFSVRKYYHYFITSVPIVGNIIYTYSLTIFLRSLGTLISAGMSVDKAYENSLSLITLINLKVKLTEGISLLANGRRISAVFVNNKIPPYVASIVSAGEGSGGLGSALIKSACMIERDIEAVLRKSTTLIEPILMIGMGGIVGCIALSIMMPIYGMSKMLQNVH